MSENPFNIQMLSQKTAQLSLILKEEVERPEELAALMASCFNDGVAFALKIKAQMDGKNIH